MNRNSSQTSSCDTQTDGTFSLASLLRNHTSSVSSDSIQILIVSDNAKRPSDELVQYVTSIEENQMSAEDESLHGDENDDDISLEEHDLRSTCLPQRQTRPQANETTTTVLQENRWLMSCPNLNYHQKLLSPSSESKSQERWCYESPKTPRTRAAQHLLLLPQRMPSVRNLL